jgi:hypothetical protein
VVEHPTTMAAIRVIPVRVSAIIDTILFMYKVYLKIMGTKIM